MNIISVSGIALLATSLSLILKKKNPEYSFIIGVISSVIISICILSEISSIISRLKIIISKTNISPEYIIILLKSLGICFITQFSCDSCKDAGENALASKIELAGKISILITALPLFESIIQTALNLIGAEK